VKHHQRLDLGRLAEVLHERGIANVDAIREFLQQSREGGMPFCEALVTTNLVPDWDLSRIVCETFSLPFLPVDLVEPNARLRQELDMKLFRSQQIVPLDRFGQVLTVIMPGLVSADTLAMLAAATDLVILPAVGTVETNRRWILENLSAGKSAEIEGGWGNLFDQADAQVAAGLGPESESFFGVGEAARGGLALAPAEDALAEVHTDDLQFEVAPSEGAIADDDGLDLSLFDSMEELEADVDLMDDETAGGQDIPKAPLPKGPSSTFEMPPMPDFGFEREAG